MARSSSRAPRYTASAARSIPVSSAVSRTAVALRSRSPGSRRPPGKPTCPDQGSSGCSARRMKRTSIPVGPSRRMRATAAALPAASARSVGRAERASRTRLHVGAAIGLRLAPADDVSEKRVRLGQPEEGHVRRQLSREEHSIDRPRVEIAQLLDLRGLRAKARWGDVGAARVDRDVIEDVAQAAPGGAADVAQALLEGDAPEQDACPQVRARDERAILVLARGETHATARAVVEELLARLA